jgi:hypothetical protein
VREFTKWPPLHDGVVNSICVRWPGAIGTIALGTSEHGNLEIIATGLTLLSCPQHYPWGRAKYLHVNEARLSKSADGLDRLEVETQAGDVIVLEAAAITLQIGGAASDDSAR